MHRSGLIAWPVALLAIVGLLLVLVAIHRLLSEMEALARESKKDFRKEAKPKISTRISMKDGRKWERLHAPVRTIGIATGSLITVYIAPIPDILKGFIIGILAAAYFSLVVYVFHFS